MIRNKKQAIQEFSQTLDTVSRISETMAEDMTRLGDLFSRLERTNPYRKEVPAIVWAELSVRMERLLSDRYRTMADAFNLITLMQRLVETPAKKKGTSE